MGKKDCITCGDLLYYSYPSLEEKRLFSQEWVDFIKKRHGSIDWKCLQCLGTENCVYCGAQLGTFDQVTGYRDNETRIFCGCEYCVDCVLDLLRSPAVLATYENVHDLQQNASTLLANGAFADALLILNEACSNLSSTEIVGRPDLYKLHAEIHISQGVCLQHSGQKKAALLAFQRSEHLYQQPSRRGQTNQEAARLSLFAAMSEVAGEMVDPFIWFQTASKDSVDIVDCLPPRRIEPYAGMRKDFERLHENWLSYALSHEEYDLIPGIIIAVQGRDLVASLVENDILPEELDTALGLEKFVLARRGLRNMMASDGTASHSYLSSSEKRLPNTEGTNFNKDFAGLRRAMKEGKTKARETEDGAFLDAPHLVIDTNKLQSVLGEKEQLLLLFENGGAAHAILISAEKKPEHIELVSLPEIAEKFLRFDTAGRNQRGMRRNVMSVSYLESECAGEDNSGDLKDFWPGISGMLKEKFWSKLDPHLFEASTLLICCSGDLHNLCLEPSQPSKIHLSTRLPGLAFFAYSRGLLGGNAKKLTSSDVKKIRVGIIADKTAKDIPMAAIEGRKVAKLWAGTNSTIEFPSPYPNSSAPLDFLHVASHGTRVSGLMGSERSAILNAGVPIGEQEILDAPRVSEALINVCVGGQCRDSPLDGNPTGLVSGFLRRDTKWVAASLLSLPDDWACLLGLIIAGIKVRLGLPLPEALNHAREMLVDGGWSSDVSSSFAAALFEASLLPRPISGNGLGPQTKGSLLQELSEILHVANKQNADASQLFEAAINTRCDLWWLTENPALFFEMVTKPQDLERLVEMGIKEAVENAALHGTPQIVGRDTVRYGITLFGDPKNA